MKTVVNITWNGDQTNIVAPHMAMVSLVVALQAAFNSAENWTQAFATIIVSLQQVIAPIGKLEVFQGGRLPAGEYTVTSVNFDTGIISFIGGKPFHRMVSFFEDSFTEMPWAKILEKIQAET